MQSQKAKVVLVAPVWKTILVTNTSRYHNLIQQDQEVIVDKDPGDTDSSVGPMAHLREEYSNQGLSEDATSVSSRDSGKWGAK